MTTPNTIPTAFYLDTLPAYTAPVRDGDSDTVLNYGPTALWSGKSPPPPLGARIFARMNNLGPGTVRAYFIESGWLGLHIELENPPDWWTKQTATLRGRARWSRLFGAEVGATP